MKINILISSWFLLLLANHLSSQAPIQTQQTWLSLQISQPLKNGFSLNGSYQLRTNNGFESLRNSFFALGASYKLNKYLEFGLAYRFGTNYTIDSHRFTASLTGSYKFGKLETELRSAYQYRTNYFATRFEPGREPTDVWRNRLTISYPITKKIDVYMFTEPYILFSYKGTTLSSWRNCVGAKWDFKKNHTLNAFYIYQPDYSSKITVNQVAGLGYRYTLPKKWWKAKKKKKD